VNKQTATYASECCMQSVHRSVFLNQVHAVLLQQLNVCRISKKRKVKAQFEGKQARLPEQ